MTIQQLLDLDQPSKKILVIKVNIVEEVEEGSYIIEDESGAGILKVEDCHRKQIEVGKGLIVPKPKRLNKRCITLTNVNPQKIQKMEIMEDHEEKIDELRQNATKTCSLVEEKIQLRIMDYNDAFKQNTWKNEREWANEIMEYVRKHNLDFSLDALTCGDGNCFVTALLQQLERKELRPDLRKIRDHKDFRKLLKNFAIKSQDTRFEEMKIQHELTRKAIGEVSWIMYWNKMTREGIWADQKFIQCSAWFFEMNIGIVDVAGNLANPYYIIDCGKATRRV